MRSSCKLTAAFALLIPLTGASCSSKHESFPAQPVAGELTVEQANVLAQLYLDQHAVTLPRAVTGEQQQPDGWWIYYQTAFDATARPPTKAYLVQVHNDGTVRQLE